MIVIYQLYLKRLSIANRFVLHSCFSFRPILVCQLNHAFIPNWVLIKICLGYLLPALYTLGAYAVIRSIGILHFLCCNCERVSLHCQWHAQRFILHRVDHQRHGPSSVHHIHHYISFQSRSWSLQNLVQLRKAKHFIFYHRVYTQAGCSCITHWDSVRTGRFYFFLRGGFKSVAKSSLTASTVGRNGRLLR